MCFVFLPKIDSYYGWSNYIIGFLIGVAVNISEWLHTLFKLKRHVHNYFALAIYYIIWYNKICNNIDRGIGYAREKESYNI